MEAQVAAAAETQAQDQAQAGARAEEPFATRYEDARARFLAIAGKLEGQGALARSFPVVSPGASGLFIDSLYLPALSAGGGAGPRAERSMAAAGGAGAPESPQNLIVLISGIHGVEAPAGSWIQRQLLSECASGGAIDRGQTGVLAIHALNPFGFKYGRRFNENNVDLNRNCFDARAGGSFPGAALENREYESLRWLYEGQPYVSLLDFAAAALFQGEAAIRVSLRGQYRHRSGIYFGGTRPQRECEIAQGLIDPLIRGARNVALIDLHTGLGSSYGINQVMTNPKPASSPAASAFAREVELLRRLFPDSECRGLCEVQVGDED